MGLPRRPLDPKHMNIDSQEFNKIVQKIRLLEDKLKSRPLAGDEKLAELYDEYHEKMLLEDKIKLVKKTIGQANSIMQLDELKCRKRVLRRLGYISADDVIEMKGRVACEISTGDELLLTEMIFNGIFNDLTVEQTVALLSCFVFEERSKQDVLKLKEELAGPLKVMQDAARRIARVSLESDLPVDEDDYVQQFRPELMDVVYAWTRGAKFSQLCKMTSVFEGSLIRVFRRLEELLTQMAAAAKSIGNVELEQKFSSGIEKIKVS